MSNRQFLQRRNNRWHVVVEVPKPLRELLDGKPRFIKSLKTDSLTEANRLKLPFVAEWKRQINLLERGKPDKFAKLREDFLAWKVTLQSTQNKWVDEDGREVNWWEEFKAEMLNDAAKVEETYGPEVSQQMMDIALGKATFIRDLVPSWINEFDGKQQTKDQGDFAVRQFLAWAGETSTIEEVNRKKAGQFIGALLADGQKSRRTIERYASSLSSFWRWLIRRGHLETDVNPWRGHELGRKSKRTDRKALPDEVVLKLLKARYAPSGQRANKRYETVLPDVLRIALATGMRLGEICELDAADVERREDGLWFNLGEGKTEAAERSVPIHPAIVPIVERRLSEDNRYLIANLVPGGSDKRRGHHVSKAFLRFRTLAGVTEKGQVFHALRNTFIACMEGHGVPESTCKLLVGHARESMTYGHYSKGERVDLRRAIEMLDYGTEIMEAICNC
jgi:integrase